MKKFNKVLAVTLLSALLCGSTVTSFAAEEEQPEITEALTKEEGNNDREGEPVSGMEGSQTPDSSAGGSTPENKPSDSGAPESSTESSTPEGSTPEGSTPESKSSESTPESKPSESAPESKPSESAPESKPSESTPESKPPESSSTPESNPQSNPGDQYVSDAWKDQVRAQLNRHYSDLKIRYKLKEDQIRRMDRIYNSAMTYMKSAGLTMSELTSYEAEVEGYLDEIAKETYSGTEKFLMLSNEVPIMNAQYDEQVLVVLSLINLGKTDIKDIVVTPTVSNDRTKWPFDINQAYDAQTIQMIQAASDTTDAYNKRMDIGWNFKVRSDVLTGCYPLPFHVTYYEKGSLVETDLTTYINIKGADPEKTLIKYPDDEEDEDKKAANPRIIVTGYRTAPEEVYAGSTFNLTVSVKNTSKETAVENVLFNMEATVEGKDADATYAAFLPTSGSSAVYKERIAPGETYDMSIEMEAKADLSQKPYVLTVNMKYDTEEQVNLSDVAHVSIPIKQEAKLDTGTAEVMPESIAVGEQSNVMFSIFNTGKTTLFNVKVNYESDTVDSGITYLGNIAPGNTGNVDSMLTGIAPDMGEGIVKAVITYEDEAGNESRFEKDLNLLVYEMTFDEGMMEDIPMETIEDETAQKKLPLAAIIGIVAAVVLVIVVIVVIVSKKRKAKKHKEDMDLLDGDDE